jgi:hypothetical protein
MQTPIWKLSSTLPQQGGCGEVRRGTRRLLRRFATILLQVPLLALESSRMGRSRVGAEDDECELMISRRRFIFCGTVVALVPLATDPYQRWMDALRARLIKLAENGFVAESLETSPPRNGQRVTYGESMRRQHEHRRRAFSKLSEGEKSAAWKSRCAWLNSELTRLVQHGQRVDSCPVCSPVDLTTHRWPEAFSCNCGCVIVLDRWLPDDKERVLIRLSVRSW